MRAILPALLLAACAPGQDAAPLRVIDRIDAVAAEVAAEPSLAADGRGGHVLSWQARLGSGETALRLRAIDAAGVAAPVVEAGRGHGWFVNWADFPAVAVLDNGDWLAHWLQRSGPGRYAYDVRVTRSTDHGRNWSPAMLLHDDGTQSEHGFVGVAPWAGDGGVVVWLDGRHTAAAIDAAASASGSAAPSDGHGHAASGGAMTLRGTALTREGKHDEAELDARVCDCCQTDAARVGDAVLVVYRDRADDEVRDVSLARYDGERWSAPEALFSDGWRVSGCPVNGPAIAAQGQGVIAAAYSEAGGEPALRVRTSRDGGQRWLAPVVVAGADSRGRVDAGALADGSFLLVHLTERSDGIAMLRLDRLDARGQPLGSQVLAEGPAGRLHGFPRLAVSGDRTLLAWTEVHDGQPRLRLVEVRVGDG